MVLTGEKLPVFARGAGTGLAGDSLGAGLVLDFSRHFVELEALDDAPLQAEQVFADRLGVDEAGHLPRCLAMNSSTASYQATMLRGFRIQGFSSGNTSSSLGTPWYCSASNRFSPSPIGQR